MIFRRHCRRLVHVIIILIVVIALIILMGIWPGLSHKQSNVIVQDGHHYLLRRPAGKNEQHLDKFSRLEEAIKKVDRNSDGLLTREEIEEWIMQKTKEHLDEGDRDVAETFQNVDVDQSGYVSWDEFFVWHQKNPERMEFGRKNEDLKEEWGVSDSDHNNVLDKKEFLCFRHPELCQETLRQLAADVIKNLDKNEDRVLTEEEYSAPAPGQVEEGFKDYEVNYAQQRKKEFQTIDLNKDRQVTEDELRIFLNPRNHIHAKMEADELVDAADENGDGLLSLAEMLKHKDLFEQSKLVDVGGNFHNDF